MKLRHAAGSPFVRKVMVLAHEHGIVDRIELVPTAVSPVQANDGLAPENPLMKVPSLVTDDGQTLFDSPVICEYLDNLASGRKLFPAAGQPRWTALRQQALGDGILDALILCRYEIAARPEEKRFSGWTDAQMRKAPSPPSKARTCPAAARSAMSRSAAPWAISISASRTTAGARVTPSSQAGTRTPRNCPRCKRPGRRRADIARRRRGGRSATTTPRVLLPGT